MPPEWLRTPPTYPHESVQFVGVKTLEELAAEQGIKVPQRLDDIIGAAADLWENDEDFDLFLEQIHVAASTLKSPKVMRLRNGKG